MNRDEAVKILTSLPDDDNRFALLTNEEAAELLDHIGHQQDQDTIARLTEELSMYREFAQGHTSPVERLQERIAELESDDKYAALEHGIDRLANERDAANKRIAELEAANRNMGRSATEEVQDAWKQRDAALARVAELERSVFEWHGHHTDMEAELGAAQDRIADQRETITRVVGQAQDAEAQVEKWEALADQLAEAFEDTEPMDSRNWKRMQDARAAYEAAKNEEPK